MTDLDPFIGTDWQVTTAAKCIRAGLFRLQVMPLEQLLTDPSSVFDDGEGDVNETFPTGWFGIL